MTSLCPRSCFSESDPAFRTCEYCQRERHACDTFWHAEDRKWYCADVFACEYRLYLAYLKWEQVQEAARQ